MDLELIKQKMDRFVLEREWKEYHTPKNLVMALTGEVGELNEIFQWLSTEEAKELAQDPEKLRLVKEEVADVFIYLERLSVYLGIDLEKAVLEKIDDNCRKYPSEKFKGKIRKYNQLK